MNEIVEVDARIVCWVVVSVNMDELYSPWTITCSSWVASIEYVVKKNVVLFSYVRRKKEEKKL